MKNPIIIKSSTTPVRGIDYKREGSNERMFNYKGEVNASSVKEVAESQVEFINAKANGKILSEREVNANANAKAKAQEVLSACDAKLRQAVATDNKDQLKAIAADMSALTYEYAARDGLMRKLLKPIKIENGTGTGPVISVDTRTLGGQFTFDAGGVTVVPQQLKDKRLYLQDFEISIGVFIDQAELYISNNNLFENKMIEVKEQIMVQEDRRWKALADSSVSSVNGGNDIQTFSSGLTTAVLGKLKALLDNQNIMAQTVVMARDLTQYLPTIATTYDPFHQYDYWESGELGRLMGLNIVTDATNHRTQRVLNQGELYVVSAPEFHGVYAERGGLVTRDFDPYVAFFRNGKGWVAAEILSMAVANSLSVVKGIIL